MAEPQTVNGGLIVPNTGDLVGTWGSAALNPDFVAIDGFLCGVQTVSASSAPIVLTSPAGFTPTPGGGPTQAQNGILRFTGVLTAGVQVTLPLPGFVIVENLTTGAFVLSFRAIGSGEVVGVEQGVIQHLYNDGTNVRFVNLPTVGSYMDLCDAATPAWITACTKPPWLLCNGATFSAVTYPYLNTKLGGTTLPDFQGRASYYLNGGTGRLTTAGAGIDGNTRFAAGGNNGVTLGSTQIPALSGANSITVSDPSSKSIATVPSGFVTSSRQLGTTVTGDNNFAPITGGGVWGNISNLSGNNSITVNPGGASVPVPSTTPGVVSGIRLIRAA